MKQKNPLLIIGAHRSGTTFTGNMISLSDEVEYIRDPFAKYRLAGLFQLRPKNFFTYISDHNADDYREQFSKMINFDYSLFKELSKAKNLSDLKTLAKDIFRFSIAKRKGKRPLLKAATAIYSSEWLEKEFGFRVFGIIRHPAAFISSLKRLSITHPFGDFLDQPNLMKDFLKSFEPNIREFAQLQKQHNSQNVPDIVDQGILLWNIIYSSIIKLKHRNPNWLFLTHEEISKDPIKNFRQIYDYFSLAYTEKIAEQIKSFTSASNPSEAQNGKWNTLKRDSSANIKNWKSRLTNDEIEKIRLNTKEIADHFYSEDDW